MSKKKSAYENVYTQQLEEAVFDQKGYDTKKEESKKKVRAEVQRSRGLMKVFVGLSAIAGLLWIGRLINLDPANSGPLAIFVTVVAAVSGFAWFINK